MKLDEFWMFFHVFSVFLLAGCERITFHGPLQVESKHIEVLWVWSLNMLCHGFFFSSSSFIIPKYLLLCNFLVSSLLLSFGPCCRLVFLAIRWSEKSTSKQGINSINHIRFKPLAAMPFIFLSPRSGHGHCYVLLLLVVVILVLVVVEIVAVAV